MSGAVLSAFLRALVIFLASASTHAQLQVATVRGVVLDQRGQPIANATIRLTDRAGAVVTTAISDNAGAFRLNDVAPGGYTIRVEVGATVILTRPLIVRGSLPIDLTLRAGPALHEEVVVHGDATFNAAEHPWTIAGDAVRGAAEPIPSQRVQAALARLPGWSAEDNGPLHVRGVDDGVLYVQDGIPVYERLDRLFGLPPNPPAIDSLHVIDGYVPPEYGFKSGAVVVAFVGALRLAPVDELRERRRSNTEEGRNGGRYSGNLLLVAKFQSTNLR